MNTHKDLIVWQKAMELVLEVYKATKTYPREELFGLASQMLEPLYQFLRT